MKLLVIVLCLLSERFLIHSISYHRFVWFERYYLFIKNLIDKNNILNNTALMLALIVLPITIITSLVYLAVDSILFGLLGLLFNIALFFYCLGPKNPFYPIIDTDVEVPEHSAGTYFAEVNNQLFSVIFWYVIGGPIAALFFRLISLSKTIPSVAVLAKDTTEILEWIPARLTVLLYLLVGNFQLGFQRFTGFLLVKPALNDQMLSECGLLAVRSNEFEEVPMPIAETLVEHAVIVLLVLVALFTLAAWL
jgi:AmpE protein